MGSGRHNVGASKLAPAKHSLPPDIFETDVRVQLERIRSSQPFRSSRHCVVFLDFVVQAALKRHLETLKERMLGVEVFGRDPNYDTNQDPMRFGKGEFGGPGNVICPAPSRFARYPLECAPAFRPFCESLRASDNRRLMSPASSLHPCALVMQRTSVQDCQSEAKVTRRLR
jgi:hypothetical protein